MSKKILMVAIMSLFLSVPAVQADVAPKAGMHTSVFSRAYEYVNKSFASLANKHFSCVRFFCGKESKGNSWQYALSCALGDKLQPNCWRAIMGEIKKIDAGKIKKGHFFAGYETLPAHVRTYLKAMLVARLHHEEIDLNLLEDIILEFGDAFQAKIPTTVLKRWEQSKKPLMAQIYEINPAHAAIGQVIKTTKGHEADLGMLFLVHADKLDDLEKAAAGNSEAAVYIAPGLPKKANKRFVESGEGLFHVKASHMVLSYTVI